MARAVSETWPALGELKFIERFLGDRHFINFILLNTEKQHIVADIITFSFYETETERMNVFPKLHDSKWCSPACLRPESSMKPHNTHHVLHGWSRSMDE